MIMHTPRGWNVRNVFDFYSSTLHSGLKKSREFRIDGKAPSI
jgi:hypothetical protein